MDMEKLPTAMTEADREAIRLLCWIVAIFQINTHFDHEIG